MFQMVIKSSDQNRFLPPSWNFEQRAGMTVWETAMAIAEAENVTIIRIIDDRGYNVPMGN